MPDSWIGLDIGPRTSMLYAVEISAAATVFWNGPMGRFELEPFELGTRTIAEAVASCKGTTVVGGGETVATSAGSPRRDDPVPRCGWVRMLRRRSEARFRTMVFVGAPQNDPEGALFDAALLPGRLERTVTPASIESRGGLTVRELAELMEAFGLPRPEANDATFTPEEAQVLVDLGELDELWPAEVRVQVARAYGAMLSGIARAELQAFQMYTEPHVREQSGATASQLAALKSAFERLLPLADPLILGVHRRWLEHELAQRAVRAAELRAGEVGLPGAVEVTFLFCDLKDFTAYAEVSGDAAAISAIDRFFDVVAHARGEGGRLVKSLGDGAMLVYGDPAEAVAAGCGVIAAMRDSGLPGVHASVHRGIAIARSGDYFGGSVNVAARLLAFAECGELVATDEVVKACRRPFDWQPAGERVLRGVAAPLTVHRLAVAGVAGER